MRWARAVAGLLLAAAPLGAQGPLRVSSAVAPETVTVGDRFRSVLQVVAPPGATVEFAALPVADALQPADSLRVIPGRAGEPPIAAYSLVAWVAGAPLSAKASVRVALPDGTAATYLVPLRLPVVRSVLPVDTAGLEPRPARGLLRRTGDPRMVWPWVLLVLSAAAAIAAWLLRRRPSSPREALTARDRALRAVRTISPGDAFDPAARVLRHYLAEVDARWSVDRTTDELLERMRFDAVPEDPRELLAALLRQADGVKFARYAPTPPEAERFLAAVAGWIAAYPPPQPRANPEQREAA